MTSDTASETTRAVVGRFLRAIDRRDMAAVLACFAADATWQNVPHPPAVGIAGLDAMLTTIVERSAEVRWDIVTESYADGRAWLERVDRFTIDGTEYAVQCNGVFEINTSTEVITAVRDYVDLGEWRARLAAASL